MANNQPLTAASTTPPTRGNPYATLINTDTYQVLGTSRFQGATGLEQPLWVPEQHRFLVTVPDIVITEGATPDSERWR